MDEPPDLFELRLDRVVRVINRLDNKISRLRAPLVITARHPMEGGANRLSPLQRHNLLARFLSRAGYIDVELRSAPVFVSLLRLARRQNVRRIISVHHLKGTPSPSRLRAQARAAKTYGADFFKVATRTDTPAQLTRLIDFAAAKDVDIAVSAMGIGKLGAASRVLLACCGSYFSPVVDRPSCMCHSAEATSRAKCRLISFARSEWLRHVESLKRKSATF